MMTRGGFLARLFAAPLAAMAASQIEQEPVVYELMSPGWDGSYTTTSGTANTVIYANGSITADTIAADAITVTKLANIWT